MHERQVTCAAHGHMLTNAAVWSPDSRWIVYDTRSSPDGSVFDGTRIERVEVESGRIEILYESQHGACCGVVTASPVDDRVIFILGPEHPTADWQYGPARRQGVVVRASQHGVIQRLDARDIAPPFTAGALRGGSHVHVYSPDGRLVSFTYEDAVLDASPKTGASQAALREKNLRGIGVSVCGKPVQVPRTHQRNHDGTAFTVLVTRLTDAPTPGSDEIAKAFEEAWIGTHGYLRPDGTRQRYALAFQGHVVVPDAALGGLRIVSEVFVCDLPEDPASLAVAGEKPLSGTPTSRPAPPRGVIQRRLTFTADRHCPGIDGPRHWLRSSPDGSRITFLMRDDRGVVQLFTVSPNGGPPVQVTRDDWSVASSFSWSTDGRRIAYVADSSVFFVDVTSGASMRLTDRTIAALPRPEACVFSPDGRRIAFMRSVAGQGTKLGDAAAKVHNQIFVVDMPEG
jgi:sugar lactone lactonase YvrE